MINNLKTMNKSDAKAKFESWDSEPLPDYIEEHESLRKEILKIFYESTPNPDVDDEDLRNYSLDFTFGIKLYIYLRDQYNFSERMASTDDLWRYLSICVVPDLVYKRWGLKDDRFYKATRRIWLKSIWWYIYLSWQGDFDNTYNILKNNTTDTVVQLVERIGPQGYRVDFSRCLMRSYSALCNKYGAGVSGELFRKIMKLNTARVKTLEPSLFKGGVEGYVEELISYFEQ